MPALAAALAATEPLEGVATNAQRAHLAAARAWLARKPLLAAGIYTQLTESAPHDLLAVRLAQSCWYFLGHRARVRLIAERALRRRSPAAPDYDVVLAMTAFGRAETGDGRGARALADRALALEPRSPFARHALAHGLATEGRIVTAHRMLADSAPLWRVGGRDGRTQRVAPGAVGATARAALRGVSCVRSRARDDARRRCAPSTRTAARWPGTPPASARWRRSARRAASEAGGTPRRWPRGDGPGAAGARRRRSEHRDGALARHRGRDPRGRREICTSRSRSSGAPRNSIMSPTTATRLRRVRNRGREARRRHRAAPARAPRAASSGRAAGVRERRRARARSSTKRCRASPRSASRSSARRQQRTSLQSTASPRRRLSSIPTGAPTQVHTRSR